MARSVGGGGGAQLQSPLHFQIDHRQPALRASLLPGVRDAYRSARNSLRSPFISETKACCSPIADQTNLGPPFGERAREQAGNRQKSQSRLDTESAFGKPHSSLVRPLCCSRLPLSARRCAKIALPRSAWRIMRAGHFLPWPRLANLQMGSEARQRRERD